MSLWWKLTVEYPAMLGDWLYLMLVVKPVEIAARLTARRIFLAVVLLAAVIVLAQSLPADMALFFATDITAYIDILVLGYLLSARGRAKDTFAFLKRKTADALRAFTAVLYRARLWIVRQGKTAIARRIFTGRKNASGDEPGAGLDFSFA